MDAIIIESKDPPSQRHELYQQIPPSDQELQLARVEGYWISFLSVPLSGERGRESVISALLTPLEITLLPES